MVVGGHQSPGGSSEWLRLITYNNQILEGAAGGGNGLAFVEHCRRGRALPMFPTDGLATKAPPSIAASVTLHLQKMRSAVARGWGGCERLIGAPARV